MSLNRLTSHFALVAGMLIAASPAFSATATGTFTVTATVANNCSVSANNVNFGTYTGALVTNTSSNITVTCNKGVAITSLLIGNGANASGTQKRMINGSEYLNYNIDVPNNAALSTCPAAATNEWNGTTGPSSANLTALFAATGGPKTIPICASVPASQFVPAGTYTDTVTMTLTYN